MIRICVAGATGRMGKAIISEALNKGFKIVGALASMENPNIGRTCHFMALQSLKKPWKAQTSTLVSPLQRRSLEIFQK